MKPLRFICWSIFYGCAVVVYYWVAVMLVGCIVALASWDASAIIKNLAFWKSNESDTPIRVFSWLFAAMMGGLGVVLMKSDWHPSRGQASVDIEEEADERR